MAFNAKKIYPIDRIPGKAVGVQIPFNGNAVFTSTYTTQDAIKNNLINFILTSPGERIFNPTFGQSLRRYVFEQISTVTTADIENYITSGIEKYFPDVQSKVQISATPDLNTLAVSVNYTIINTGINDSIQITLNNG